MGGIGISGPTHAPLRRGYQHASGDSPTVPYRECEIRHARERWRASGEEVLAPLRGRSTGLPMAAGGGFGGWYGVLRSFDLRRDHAQGAAATGGVRGRCAARASGRARRSALVRLRPCGTSLRSHFSQRSWSRACGRGLGSNRLLRPFSSLPSPPPNACSRESASPCSAG